MPRLLQEAVRRCPGVRHDYDGASRWCGQNRAGGVGSKQPPVVFRSEAVPVAAASPVSPEVTGRSICGYTCSDRHHRTANASTLQPASRSWRTPAMSREVRSKTSTRGLSARAICAFLAIPGAFYWVETATAWMNRSPSSVVSLPATVASAPSSTLSCQRTPIPAYRSVSSM